MQDTGFLLHICSAAGLYSEAKKRGEDTAAKDQPGLAEIRIQEWESVQVFLW